MICDLCGFDIEDPSMPHAMIGGTCFGTQERDSGIGMLKTLRWKQLRDLLHSVISDSPENIGLRELMETDWNRMVPRQDEIAILKQKVRKLEKEQLELKAAIKAFQQTHQEKQK